VPRNADVPRARARALRSAKRLRGTAERRWVLPVERYDVSFVPEADSKENEESGRAIFFFDASAGWRLKTPRRESEFYLYERPLRTKSVEIP